MLISMLRAVEKMLEDSDPKKVECARDVVKELIKHLSDDAPPIIQTLTGDSSLDQEASTAQQELMGGTP